MPTVSPHYKERPMNEDKFILKAVRVNLSEKDISILKEISATGIDWDSFEKKVSMHGVSTFIYYSLKKHDLTEILPEEILGKFKTEYYSVACRNTILLEEFNKLSKTITNKIIPLKGIDLIESLYPSIAIRSMCDIDILVEKEYALENWNKLLHNDFEHNSIAKSKVHKIVNDKMISKHLPALYTKRYKVEIHWNLFEGNRLYEISKNAWLKPIHDKGNIYKLSNEMMLIHLCSHFYHHLQKGAILRMLCDINEFIFKYKDIIDWDEIERKCSESDLKNEIDTALTYSHVLFNTPLPQSFVSVKIMNKPNITISSLLGGVITLQKYSTKRYFQRLKKVSNPLNMINLIFRTFFPVKAWMVDKYDVTTNRKRFKAYLQYWQDLINTYFLMKK